MVVGLTGGIGSGKTTVLNIFSNFNNVAIYQADIEAKKLMSNSLEIKKELINEFGADAYINNKLNRSFIAGIVFKDAAKLKTLNSIVHPAVEKHFKAFILSNNTKDYILYENAILFENGSDRFCDKIITVTAPEKTRINRVVKRDNTTEIAVKNRIKNQWKEEKKILQSHYIINNISLIETQEIAIRIHNILTNNQVYV
ncbi:dephospho-CoA kinase [Lutibacter sp. Hel_I_33_5]|uniref:dephospho-CoA kinase n=1 Tax=Lutibacter sp. Hel_I_33_5 TaxID=1566289 RepID=UPI0011AD1EC2|nr:dephospho-CoA kinase [Lutibacter sp. Hel_I_33_5]TVZ55453.1 dephospho-CoA kinase [Lutibacter sp. Hel_I_33_5]